MKKEILTYCKNGTLRWIRWDLFIQDYNNKKIKEDKKAYKTMFDIFHKFCKTIPSVIKIKEILIYGRTFGVDTSGSQEYKINSNNSDNNYLKKATEIYNALDNETVVSYYDILADIKGCDLENPIIIGIELSSLPNKEETSVKISLAIHLEHMNMFGRKKVKPEDLEEIDKYMKSFAKEFTSKSYLYYEYTDEWEDNLDVYKDYFGRDVSKRALRLLDEGKIDRFRWDLYLTRINGKGIDIRDWGIKEPTKEQYNTIKESLKLIINNLPDHFKIDTVEIVTENIKKTNVQVAKRKLFDDPERYGIKSIEIKNKTDNNYIKNLLNKIIGSTLVKNLLNNIDSIKWPNILNIVKIFINYEGIKDLFVINIYIDRRNWSRKFPINCKIDVSINKEINKEHILKIHEWVNNLLKKKIGFELDYVTYWEK